MTSRTSTPINPLMHKTTGIPIFRLLYIPPLRDIISCQRHDDFITASSVARCKFNCPECSHCRFIILSPVKWHHFRGGVSTHLLPTLSLSRHSCARRGVKPSSSSPSLCGSPAACLFLVLLSILKPASMLILLLHLALRDPSSSYISCSCFCCGLMLAR